MGDDLNRDNGTNGFNLPNGIRYCVQWRVVMKRLLIVLVCLIFSVAGMAQSGADSPATKDDVERYLEAIHSHEMMKQMMQAMAKPMHQMVHEQYMKDKDKLPADFETRMNKVMDEMMKDMPMDEMMDSMVPAYQKHFTKGDIDALIAFYSAPTGQKVLRELPAIMSEAMESMMPIMRKSIDKMTERMQQQVAEMVKESPKQSLQPAQN
jgi:hypothetical protein